MTLALLLLQIVAILAACWAARKVLRWFGQPPVVGEIIAGFSYTGIRTNFGQVSGGLWWYELAIIAVAVAGKAGGAFAGARIMGFSVRDSIALGSLMNTRGLVGLVVLNVGMDLGILSPALFAMMVMMALATTLMAAPVLKRVLPPRIRASDTESLIGGRAIGDRA